MGGPSGPAAPQTHSRNHCSQEGGWSPSQERPYPRERASWAAVLGEDKHGLLTGHDVGAGETWLSASPVQGRPHQRHRRTWKM